MADDTKCPWSKLGPENLAYKGMLLDALLTPSCPNDNCRLKNILRLSFDFSHHLLQAHGEEDLWATVLVAVTAREGLGFNRAFILEKVAHANALQGKAALGPPSAEAAAQIWQTLEKGCPSFSEMVRQAKTEMFRSHLSSLARSLYISLDVDHGFSKALEDLDVSCLRQEEEPLLGEIFEKLGVKEIGIVPLGIAPHIHGFLMVDNFVNREPMEQENLQFLKILAVQTSLALQRLNLCKEVEQQKALLIEAERLSALGQLASKVFHEIRNPISAVGGLSRLLLKKDTSQELKLYLETIRREAARLEKVLEDLFEFIRPIELHPEPIGLYRLLQTSLNLLQADFRQAGIHIALDIIGREPIVCVDQEEMRLVFLHLLQNALEAMPEGGVLKIKVRVGEEGLHIEFVDSGVGIPKAYLKRVTEPFFTTKTYGSGLGLSVAKRIVELHGGQLHLQPIKPSGTKAVISLPLEVLCNGG